MLWGKWPGPPQESPKGERLILTGRREVGSPSVLDPLTSEHEAVSLAAEWDLGGLGLSYQAALHWLYAFEPASEAL